MENNIMPEFNLGIVDAIKERAQKIGSFLFGHTNPEVAYPSDHRRIPEPTDGEAYQPELPFDKQAAVNHYVQLAKEARGE